MEFSKLRCDVGSGVGFCDNQNGLLQLHSGSTSSVVNRSTATGPECSRQTHHWHRNTRAHYSSASESALAPSKVSHNVQTVRTYASGAYWPCSYLSDIVTATAHLPSQGRLRSSNTFRYELPILKRKFGERGFSYAGPKAWNDLPFALQELTDTCTFKRQLKHHWSL